MKFKAYAKINLSLDIVGKMENGYHELRMIMHSVDLFDDVDITLNDTGEISVSTNLHYLPNDRKNLAYRAAECFFNETGINKGADISVFKRIPVCAGLAGGSTDAAAVLRGLNEMTGAGLSLKNLAEMGKTLGADVPYCVHGGTMLAEGIGDTIRVSLTGDPVREVKVGFEILKSLGLREYGPTLISCPTCGRTQINLEKLALEVEKRLAEISEPITVAVMGCVVNGPGEAKEADIGVAGGDGCGVIFKHGEVLKKVNEDEIVEELLKEIEKI